MAARARLASAAAAVMLLAVPWLPGDETGGEPAIVYFADGSNMPLASWSLSYEYDASAPGTARAFGSTSRRESHDLFSGKKALPTAGAVLQVQYREYEQSQEVDGETKSVKVTVATGLTLTQGGKKSELKLEAPSKEFLLPQGDKGMARALGLDLQGSTLTGTKRSFCLVSYSFDVECHPSASDRVVKVEFPK